MDKIKVLWMNNGDESLWTFVANSSLQNLNIVSCDATTECRNKLRHEYWDAIFLNAEPKMISKDQNPDIRNLHMAYMETVKYAKEMPIFVVTANKLIDDANKMMARVISGGKFYVLQDSSSQLYEDVKAEVENNADYRIRKEFEVVCDFFSQIDDSDELLMILLRGLKDEKLYKDPRIPGTVRLILDKVMLNLNNKRILPIKFTGSNLADCSRWLGDERGDAKNIVPIHVQRCFHSCVVIANNGDHNIPQESQREHKERIGNPLYVQKQIGEKAPYLNKALIYDLLNILYWCASLDENTFEL